MKKLIILAITNLFLGWSFGQSPAERYDRIRVSLSETHISELAELGLDYDHGIVKKGLFWVNDVSEKEQALLRANDIAFEILIPDVGVWYAQQNKHAHSHSHSHSDPVAHPRNNVPFCGTSDLIEQYETPSNYTYGSMGGFHTYTELLSVLDDMKAKFPNLISEKQPIGDYLTAEGRPIYWLKVGVNPDVDEDKPAILYNALHHAREPSSLSQMLFYMWYLLENYESDEEVKFLMDNVEMYFIPCLNPDGYVFNERIAPEGGGLWRKNRWVNSQGDTVGVDLNRNYGFKGGLDDAGSSSDQTSLVYRGTAPFSEPETQAIRDFCVQHQFKIALNYHAFSNLLIIPWGFDSELTPDDATFRAITNKLTEQNNYLVGTGLETVGYVVNGDSDDWMYGEQGTKPKIFSMTPEVGSSAYGFWPPADIIDQYNKENMWQNLSAAALVRPYGEILETGPRILDAPVGTLTFGIRNIGLEAGTFTVTVASQSEDFQIVSTPQTVTADHLELSEFTVDYTIVDATKLSQNFTLELVVNNGFIDRTFTVTKEFYSVPFEFLFTDMVGENLTNWTASDTWGTTAQTFYSEDYSITDSPFGNYPDMANSFVQTKTPVDLQGVVSARVKFRAKWELETNYDYVQFEIKSANGNWTPLCGKFSVANSFNEPAFNGNQPEWVLDDYDLQNYIGEEVLFRFTLKSDELVNADGFFFDDFEVEVVKNDGTTSVTAPTVFSGNTLLVQPNPFVDNLSIAFSLKEPQKRATLRLVNPLGQTVATRSLQNLPSGPNQWNWTVDNLPNGAYILQLETPNQQSIFQKVVRGK